jgi:hypothetical protein
MSVIRAFPVGDQGAEPENVAQRRIRQGGCIQSAAAPKNKYSGGALRLIKQLRAQRVRRDPLGL